MKIYLILATIVMFLMFTAESCEDQSKTKEVYNTEQNHTLDNQTRLNSAQPAVSLNWSLERENINNRTKLWNNPNKVSYIYLINYGRVMAFYTIKGKVSSVNSQVTNTQQVIDRYNQGNISSVAIPSPSEDGSYGTNGDAIFFFTTDGSYVEYRGDFMLCDKPLKLTTAPELVREIK